MGRLVYSTDKGRLCPDCGRSQCSCQAQSQAKPGDSHVRIAFETKGRKGKGATIVTGIPLAGKELKALHKQLKQKTSTGGTIKGNTLELQGDQRDKLLEILAPMGFLSVKKSGG